ncbi:MAG: hypothetical protein ACHQF4_09380 [Sphingobacteriales bacterium]
MTEITIINEGDSNQLHNFSKGYLTFPFDADQFKNFITGLLGRPQTITKYFHGNFTLFLTDLQNFHELIMQRVVQQNNGALIQFNAKIFYDDRSSVELGSYDELLSYNEVKPVISHGVELSWSFLLLFNAKDHPEKQTIELTITTKDYHLVDETEWQFFNSRVGNFKIRIQHTARSWGSDIENLLKSQIDSCIRHSKGYKKIITKYRNGIGFLFGTLICTLNIIGLAYVTNRFISSQIDKMKVYTSIKSHTVVQKLDYLLTYSASSVSNQHYFNVLIFFVIGLAISIFLGRYINSLIEHSREPSFLVLTRKAKENMDLVLKDLSHFWRDFFITIAVGIFSGVISNIIFSYCV